MKKTTVQKGSLLIETVLAFGMLSIALIVSIQTFTETQKSYRRTEGVEATARALAFFLEELAREARVSEDFSCDIDCNPIEMKHVRGINGQGEEIITYTLTDENTISKEIDSSDPVLVTPPTIRITAFDAQVFSPNASHPLEPNRLHLCIEAVEEGVPSAIPLKVCTTITSRF